MLVLNICLFLFSVSIFHKHILTSIALLFKQDGLEDSCDASLPSLAGGYQPDSPLAADIVVGHLRLYFVMTFNFHTKEQLIKRNLWEIS